MRIATVYLIRTVCKTQDRDRLQDGIGDDVPDQGRDQDRDRLRDSSLHIGDVPIQDRDQLRDRLRDQLQNPDQDRDRNRIRANDSTGLEEVIVTSEAVSDDLTNGLGAELRELARNRKTELRWALWRWLPRRIWLVRMVPKLPV